MYLHLGGSTVVPAAEVVTIVDARILGSEANKRLVEEALAAGRLSEAALRGCKALVITTQGVYPSAISPQSLARRLAGPFSPGG